MALMSVHDINKRLLLHHKTLQLTDDIVADLHVLKDYQIVVVADDSGSMSTITINPDEPEGTKIRRWDELLQTVLRVTEIATCFDCDGIDVYFLNAGQYKNLTTPQEVTELFRAISPSGHTPLAPTIKAVMDDCVQNMYDEAERRLLIIVATDGEGVEDASVRSVLQKRRTPSRCPIALLSFNDDPLATSWMRCLDREFEFLDTTDDFNNEARRVMAATGEKLSHGLWLAKCLLGPILERYDAMDASYVPRSAEADSAKKASTMRAGLAGVVGAGAVIAGAAAVHYLGFV